MQICMCAAAGSKEKKMEENRTDFWKKAVSWVLACCLVVTLIPQLGYATKADAAEQAGSKAQKQETKQAEKKISPEDVTEKNVTDKTETSTTYSLGGGEKMTVFHGGSVRFQDEEGNLTDYDPELVEIKAGETTEEKESLKGYKYRNKTGDEKQYLPQKLSEDTPLLL